MIIDTPEMSQTPELRSLWKEAFGDTEDFLDDFWQTAFDANRCRCAMTDGKVVAALYWFDCLCMEKRIAYVYAVATAKSYRGRGISHALMEDAHQHLAKFGYEGAVLVPGSEELFRFYEGMGYRVCSTVHEFSCNAAVDGGEDVSLRSIDKTQYARLRRQMMPDGGVVQENENLDFLQTQAQFYTGPGFLLAARIEADQLVGVELLGDEAKAPGIVKALGCAQGSFRTPGGEKPFAVYLPFKESVHVAPAYFGLAFD